MTYRIALSLLLVLSAGAAQERRAKPTLEIETMADGAMAAPPELAADLLLSLVELGHIPSKQQRLEMIEQAFHLAGQARFAIRQTAAVTRASHTDSSPGIRSQALARALSRVGIQSRAVRLALPLDKGLARDLFRRISLAPLPTLTCEDALAPHFDEYYEALREVALNAFTPKEHQEGKPLEEIAAAVHAVTVPRQVEPLARLLAGLTAAPPDRQAELANLLAGVVKRMDAGPRSFGAGVFGVAQGFTSLAAHLQSAGQSTIPLVDAFRDFFTRHMQGIACAETVDPKRDLEWMRRIARQHFNETLLAKSGAGETIEPIRFDDLKPTSVQGSAVFSDYWQSGRGREIMAGYKKLRFGTEEQQAEYNKRERRKDGMAHFLPDELRRTPEWEAQARDFLRDLDRWQKTHDDNETDFFHQTCLQYAALLDIIPPGRLFDDVLAAYIGFLKTSPLAIESPPEWLHHLRRLFTVTDATPQRLEHIRAHVRAGGSHTMSLYAQLAALEAKRRGN